MNLVHLYAIISFAFLFINYSYHYFFEYRTGTDLTVQDMLWYCVFSIFWPIELIGLICAALHFLKDYLKGPAKKISRVVILKGKTK